MLNRFLCSTYRAVLAAHPPCFREEFGDEMALIFEESLATRSAAAFPLLADGVISAVRQWFLGYRMWGAAIAAGSWFAFFVELLGLLARRGFHNHLSH